MSDVRDDLYRLTGKRDTATLIRTLWSNLFFRRIAYYRWSNQKGPVRRLVRMLNHHLAKRQTLDLPPTCKIGPGLLFTHPYAIAINSQAVVGKNLTMLKGSTIGNSKTGRVGAPVIGDNCYIGLNSSVVGGVRIGNDVMIAPNTFVNFDVPDGALVLGNPGVIHMKEKASEAYITNPV